MFPTAYLTKHVADTGDAIHKSVVFVDGRHNGQRSRARYCCRMTE